MKKKVRYDERELAIIESSNRLDAAESVFLARELTHIRAQVLEVRHANLNAFSVFPVQTDIPSGAETAIQRVYDMVGMAEIISNYSDDLRRVDLVAEEKAVKVYLLGDAYGYNYREIKNAQFAGRNLDTMKGKAARRGIDLKLNKIAWHGDKTHKITGFLDNPNVNEYVLPADGAGGKTQLKTKAEVQILRDLNGFVESIADATNDVEHANTLLLPSTLYAVLSTSRLENSDRTLMDFFRQAHPEITRIMKVGELKGAGENGEDVMICGYFDPMYIRFEIPTRFDQLPVQFRNLEYVVDCVAETAGVNINMPFAFSKATGC